MLAPTPGCQQTLWGQLLLRSRVRRQALQSTLKIREGVGFEQGGGPDHLQRPFQSQVCCGSVRMQLVPRNEEHHAPKNTQSPWHAQGTSQGTVLQGRSRLGAGSGVALCLDSPRTTRSTQNRIELCSIQPYSPLQTTTVTLQASRCPTSDVPITSTHAGVLQDCVDQKA